MSEVHFQVTVSLTYLAVNVSVFHANTFSEIFTAKLNCMLFGLLIDNIYRLYFSNLLNPFSFNPYIYWCLKMCRKFYKCILV